MKKNIFILLVCFLALGLVLVGCGGGGGGGDTPTLLPAELQNTSWENAAGYGIHFYQTTIEKFGNWGGVGLTVMRAENNGRILGKMGDATIWHLMDMEIVCLTYSIDTSKTPNEITFTGSQWDHLNEGPFVKQ